MDEPCAALCAAASCAKPTNLNRHLRRLHLQAVMNYSVTAATLLGRFTFRLADEVRFLSYLVRHRDAFRVLL